MADKKDELKPKQDIKEIKEAWGVISKYKKRIKQAAGALAVVAAFLKPYYYLPQEVDKLSNKVAKQEKIIQSQNQIIKSLVRDIESAENNISLNSRNVSWLFGKVGGIMASVSSENNSNESNKVLDKLPKLSKLPPKESKEWYDYVFGWIPGVSSK